MRWLLGVAVLVGWTAASEPALAQRGPVYRPAPRIEPYRPPPRIEPMRPMPRIEPAPRVEPLPPVPEPYRDYSGGDDDYDNDGFSYRSDCNDRDASVNPNAYDAPGGRDMDCDGYIDG